MNPLNLTLAMAGGLVAGYLIRFCIDKLAERSALQTKERILQEARHDAEQVRREMELEAKQDIIQRREEFENEVRQTRRELRQTERRLDKRQDSLEDKEQLLNKKEKFLETGEKTIAEKRRQLSERQEELDRLEEQKRQELYRISGLSREEAKRVLADSLRQEVEDECTEMINSRVEAARRRAGREAQRIVIDSIERCAAETTSEATVCTVSSCPATT